MPCKGACERLGCARGWRRHNPEKTFAASKVTNRSSGLPGGASIRLSYSICGPQNYCAVKSLKSVMTRAKMPVNVEAKNKRSVRMRKECDRVKRDTSTIRSVLRAKQSRRPYSSKYEVRIGGLQSGKIARFRFQNS